MLQEFAWRGLWFYDGHSFPEAPSEEPAVRPALSCSSAVHGVVFLAIQLMFDGTQIAIINTLKWPISWSNRLDSQNRFGYNRLAEILCKFTPKCLMAFKWNRLSW